MTYEVGISLNLKENLTSKLTPMVGLVERLERSMLRANRTMQTSVGKTTSGLVNMNKQLAATSTSARSLNSVVSGMNQVHSAAQRTTRQVGMLANAWKGMEKGLMVFGKLAFAVWGAQQIGGLIGAAAHPSIALAQAQNQMALTGFSPSAVQGAPGLTNDIRRRFPGISQQDAMQMLIESKAVFGNEKAAQSHLPRLAEAEMVMRAMQEQGHFKGQSARSHAMALIKSAEMQGGVSNDKIFNQLLGQMINANLLSGGRLTPEILQQQLATEGPARYELSPTANMNMLMHFAQETSVNKGGGRGRAGSIMAIAMQSLLSGVMSKTALGNMTSFGLLHGEKGPVSGADVLRNDPLAWAAQEIIPRVMKYYPNFHQLPQQNQQAVLDRTVLAGLPKNTRTFISEITLDATRANIERQIAQRSSMPGADDRMKLASQSPNNKMAAVEAAWTHFLAVLGSNKALTLLGSKLPGLLTRFLDSLTRVAEQVNKITERLMSSSNSINRVAVAVGRGLEGVVKGLWWFVQQIGNVAKTIGNLINFAGAASKGDIGGMMQSGSALGGPAAAKNTVDFWTKPTPNLVDMLRQKRQFWAPGAHLPGQHGSLPLSNLEGGNTPVYIPPIDVSAGPAAAAARAKGSMSHRGGIGHHGRHATGKTFVHDMSEMTIGPNGAMTTTKHTVDKITIVNNYNGADPSKAKEHAEKLHHQLKKSMLRDARQAALSSSSGAGNYQSPYFTSDH